MKTSIFSIPYRIQFFVGRALVATFLMGDKTNTNVSNVYFIPYISFSGKYGFELYLPIWLKKTVVILLVHISY